TPGLRPAVPSPTSWGTDPGTRRDFSPGGAWRTKKSVERLVAGGAQVVQTQTLPCRLGVVHQLVGLGADSVDVVEDPARGGAGGEVRPGASEAIDAIGDPIGQGVDEVDEAVLGDVGGDVRLDRLGVVPVAPQDVQRVGLVDEGADHAT